MTIQQFFYGLVGSLILLMAFGLGVMGTAVLWQNKQSNSSIEWQVADFNQIKLDSPQNIKMITVNPSSTTLSTKIGASAEQKTPSQPLAKTATSLTHVISEPTTTTQTVQTSKNALPTLPYYEIETDTLNLYFAKQWVSHQKIKRALTRLLLSDHLIPPEALLSTESIATHKVPFLYGKVVDHNQQGMRYPAQVYRFIDHLLAHPEQYFIETQKAIKISLPLKSHSIGEPIHKYQQWVSRYAKQFSVSPALVFAIMETESGFNPYAVSRSNALGLMQLKPEAAGQDVYRHIDFKTGEPEPEELFDSQNNIRMGTAYLGMLKNAYLAKVQNKVAKKILAIASYNGGLSTVLKLFGRDKDTAIARINRLNPRQIYRKLRQQHPSAETRAYIDKVLHAEMKYQKIL